MPSEIIGLHWRRIRPDPGPDPHLKCHRIHRIRLDLPRMRGRGAPDPHLKGHRIRRIRLGLRRVGRPSAVAPHLNCHPFHLIRLGWRTIKMPGVRCTAQSRKVFAGLDGYPAFARRGVHKRSGRQGAFGRGRQRPATPWGCSLADLRALVGCRVGQNLLGLLTQNMFAVSRLSSPGQHLLESWAKSTSAMQAGRPSGSSARPRS